MKFLMVFIILLSAFETNCSLLENLALKFGKINILPDEQENFDEKLITLKLSHLLKQAGYYPERLMEWTNSGDSVSLRQFRTHLREKIAQLVSAACFGDLLYFADSLLETALAQYDLANSCIRNDNTNCSCATRVDDAIKENSWTLDVLDSIGKFPSGVLTGNFYMLGDFEECVQIDVPKSSHKHKWHGQYCRVDVALYGNKWYENFTTEADQENTQAKCSGAYAFKYGTCFPSTCTLADVQAIVDFVLNLPQKLSGKKVLCSTKVYCHKELEIQKDTPALVVIFLFVLTLFVTIFGTMYDYFVYQKVVENVPSIIHVVVRKESERLQKAQNGQDHSIYLETQNQFQAKQPWLVKFLLAFSVYTNGKKIFDTKQKPGQLHCIHGIRVLSMLWVILGHTYYTSWNYIDNPLGIVTDMVAHIYNHMLINSTVSTDTFYLLSGTLIAYLWLKGMKKTNGTKVLSGKLWIMYYVHRYVRLTPVYVVVLAIHAILIRYVTDGPLWDQNGIDFHGCANSWWTNLLYINNFVWLKEQCMTWTWYLANDFQFYAFAPPILIILWKKEILGLLLIGVLILSTSMLRMSLILAHDRWPPISIVLNDLSLQETTIIDGFWETIYMKPYCRCGPFLVGLILGYILYKTKLKVSMPMWASCIGWMMSTGLAMGILFGLYEYSKTTYISFAGLIIYAAFGRVLWSVAVSWVIFACSTGHGSAINTFLSCTFWIPLSRLVYCAYLIHPLLINVFYASQMRPAHYSGHFLYVTFFFTNVVVSFSLALLFSLMFEVPIMGLEKIIFGRNTEEVSKEKIVDNNERQQNRQ